MEETVVNTAATVETTTEPTTVVTEPVVKPKRVRKPAKKTGKPTETKKPVKEPKGKVKASKAPVEPEKKKPGRPRLYDHDVLLKHLRKYEGKCGGLKAAHGEVMKLKGYEKIAYMNLALIAQKNAIRFGLGKPPEKKKVEEKKPTTKATKKAAAA